MLTKERNDIATRINERVEFEQWCSRSGHLTDWTRCGSGYAKTRTNFAWMVWQASRRAAEPTAKPWCPTCEGEHTPGDKSYGCVAPVAPWKDFRGNDIH